MRYNNSFMSGMMAGLALGAIMVIALTPQVRQPMAQSMGSMGSRMRRVWHDGADMVSAMMPGNAD